MTLSAQSAELANLEQPFSHGVFSCTKKCHNVRDPDSDKFPSR